MSNINDGELARYYFHQGTNFEAYKYLGVHSEIENGESVYYFRVWAPNAHAVFLVGDFNNWERDLPMLRVSESGIWEIRYVPERDITGNCYKYLVCGPAGDKYKSDPYAVYGETRSKTASYVFELSNYEWHDAGWLKNRKKTINDKRGNYYPAPLNIYEVHLGSWKRCDDGSGYGYRELADMLVKYVKSMGYTHIELMPIAEHPFDGSWGYQVCGYYAPTSRFGTPEDFRYFVDTMHRNGVGVILDWVPAHFPKDEHGLCEFDGTRLYEYQSDQRVGNEVWGTHYFDVGRTEVQSFLVSNAVYWLKEYHVDGLRVDAVASMLYLDYDREPGKWTPNYLGDNKNLEAIAFFKKLNTAVFERFPDALMIAEESTSWPMITRPVEAGGLGFNFKWNMGWANDMFDYLSLDPFFRQYHHKALTFPMMYAYSENFILPVSHDEVVYGKKTLLDKCSGDYLEKFATDRAVLGYMMTFPGKKLLFMGQEYGQFREWNSDGQLEWFMCDFEMHAKLREYVQDLNCFYLESPQLWELDFSWEGFEWVYPDLAGWNMAVYRRLDKKGGELLCIVNFAASDHLSFEIDVTSDEYAVAFTSDLEKYGGSGRLSDNVYRAYDNGSGKRISIDIPALSATVLKPADHNKKIRR